MKRISYLIMFVLVLGFVSCGKDGSEGPLGPRGERGEKGNQGAKGADGTLLRYGNGAPAASLGNEGDFYIDLNGSKLYGPKVKNSWGTGSSIKGDTGAKGNTGATGAKGDKGATGTTGAAGKDGSQFLAGTVVPTTQGKVGDFYFRTTTATLYGPKASSGWGAGVSLKGAKGDKGDKGDKGNPGNANVRSSGWVSFDASKWGLGGYGSTSTLDLSIMGVANGFDLNVSNNLESLVMVYVRGAKFFANDTGSDMVFPLPVRNKLPNAAGGGDVEYRFAHGGDPNYAVWVHINVALQAGVWNQNYMRNTFLPSLEFKMVVIPPTMAKAHKRALDSMDLNDYEQVRSYFNLKD